MVGQPRRVDLSRAALLGLLDRLDGLDEQGGTWYRVAGETGDLPAPANELAAGLGASPTGLAVFCGPAAAIAVSPPFPIAESSEHSGYATAPLRELLTRARTLGVILVRLGGYSVGVYQGGTFVHTKTGGRFVKNRHRKGGQSQRRFERIREGQIREQFDAVAEVIRTHILLAAAALDGVVLGGNRHTVQALLKRAPLPPPLAAKLSPRFIDLPEPRRAVLERSPAAIWTSRALIRREPPPM
jgi:peptide subunit release factor 1 (eRF1)